MNTARKRKTTVRDFERSPAERGIIYDRNGIVIAENEPAFHIVTSREHLPADPNDRWIHTKELTEFLNVDVNEVFHFIEDAKSFDEQVLLIENISYEDAMRFSSYEQRFYGFSLEVGSRRSYYHGSNPISFTHSGLYRNRKMNRNTN